MAVGCMQRKELKCRSEALTGQVYLFTFNFVWPRVFPPGGGSSVEDKAERERGVRSRTHDLVEALDHVIGGDVVADVVRAGQCEHEGALTGMREH